jgi:Protein of unknown function (DUF2510)
VTPAAGWYPDPLELWDVRWWDGVTWQDAVRTGTHQDVEPVLPIADLVAATPRDGIVWQAKRGVDAVHSEHYVVTGHDLRVYKNLSRPPEQEWELWTIGRVEPRVTGGQTLMGLGDVVLTIAYEGFAGRSTAVLKRISEPARSAAWIYRYCRLARRAAGFPEPVLPRR